MLRADEIIVLLELRPLPREGGYYRETYRSSVRLAGGKAVSTAMYYLLTPDTCSALHRLPTDEVFHFYLGDPVEMLQLFPDRSGRVVTLGPDLRTGQQPQVVVPAGVWQGSALQPGGTIALLGTTVAPGFDFADYEAGTSELARQYPEFASRIERLL